MEREGDFGNFMDFYNRQKSPIYDGRGNVTGYNHGYGKREDFDKPIPRDEYKGPGPEMGESRREKPNDDRVYIGGPSPIRGVPGHDYVNKPEYKDHRDRQPRREIVTKPTRDLNDDRVWTGGSPDFDEDSGTYRPGFRDEGIPEYGYKKTEKERRRENRRGELVNRPTVDPVEEAKRQGTYRDAPFLRDGRRGDRRGGKRGGGRREWWNEPKDNRRGIGSLGNVPPRVDYARPPRNDTDRWEKLTGGNRLASDSERMDLLTGKRSLPGDSERMRLLTGESDSGREYDPQDREFNRQFNTAPRGKQAWDSDSPSNPLERDPLEGYNSTSDRYTEPHPVPKSHFKNFLNNVRDTITPSAYEYGGNIARSAFQGGKQVNRTDYEFPSISDRTDKFTNNYSGGWPANWLDKEYKGKYWY